MRISIILIILFVNLSSNAQELNGRWHWENENLVGDVFFGSESYFIKVYKKGTDVKITESFQYYRISNDSLIFSEHPFEENPDSFSYYKIMRVEGKALELLDLKNNEIDKYSKIDNKVYNHDKVNIDEFYFHGGSIVCVSENVFPEYNNCLNFSTIGILSSKEEIESVLGEPYSTIEKGETTFTIYLIPSDSGSPPYVAISCNDKGLVESMQLTGNKTSDEFAFSGIRLGDYYTMVEKRVGKPRKINQLDEQTELWSYDPFTISFEIKNEHVYSIKLSRK